MTWHAFLGLSIMLLCLSQSWTGDNYSAKDNDCTPGINQSQIVKKLPACHQFALISVTHITKCKYELCLSMCLMDNTWVGMLCFYKYTHYGRGISYSFLSVYRPLEMILTMCFITIVFPWLGAYWDCHSNLKALDSGDCVLAHLYRMFDFCAIYPDEML